MATISMIRIISASLSPNTEFDDVWLAARLLCAPWVWQRGTAPGKVESWFRNYLKTACAVTFNSGRSALLAILKAFDVGKGDEVIIQAFTCVAVPNSIRWAGAIPVYADIEGTFNLDPADVEKKITSKTKAIIVQHTFGIPAKLDEIISIAKKYNIIVIEDCAHSLGETGRLGDAAFFSFGRDKVVSSVFGGLATIRDDHQKQIAALKAYHKKLAIPFVGWTFQQLFHPVAFAIILPLYRLEIGKLLLSFLQKIKLLSFPVYREEKYGRQPDDFPAKYPNALATLLLKQLKKLERFSKQRREISRMYGSDGAFLRFPRLVDNPELVIANAKKRGILLGNWYHNVIDPTGVELKNMGYKKGSCPRAEEASEHIINLPTRISPRQARRVLNAL
ncbi:MAG: aminotransferase class I/II-fold pyridoxal phosphate-dependent enzyme [Candidatus Gottesmanbacteria bacterium]|nr:aminotransferase class I/II-fold pyridoxal phosphate-dependent enzyme [Candidatus Gottesmanbacteria bacterium]